MWHKGLFRKIQRVGISGKFSYFIKVIYKKNNWCVTIGNKITDVFEFSSGVRQGCRPLKPYLFPHFVNDRFAIVNQNTTHDIDNNQKLSALIYIDDLLFHTKADLQNKINVLNNYCTKWRN